VITKRKLIEVALPLQAINEAAAREKSASAWGHPEQRFTFAAGASHSYGNQIRA
jgi:adenine-specific DNA methylase